jgi:hypothetical protein
MKKNKENMPKLLCQECGKDLHWCEECKGYHCNNIECKRYEEETEQYLEEYL